MRFKTTLLAATAATLTILGACDQPTALATAETVMEQRFAPTSAIDPNTGEPVASNYRSEGTVVTIPWHSTSPRVATQAPASCYEFDPYCYPDYPPCDPIYEYGCEPCPANNPDAWCYVPPCTPDLISGYTTRRTGTDPYHSLEVSGTVASGCDYLVLTGIGGRIVSGKDWTTLHLRGRRIRSDGSWGEIVTYRYGSEPNHALEAWGQVPSSATDFYGIVGISVGQGGSGDLRTLVIYYRKLELTVAGVRATGPIYQLNVGQYPYGSSDVSYITYADNEVFVGAGFRSSAADLTTTMAAYIGTLP